MPFSVERALTTLILPRSCSVDHHPQTICEVSEQEQTKNKGVASQLQACPKTGSLVAGLCITLGQISSTEYIVALFNQDEARETYFATAYMLSASHESSLSWSLHLLLRRRRVWFTEVNLSSDQPTPSFGRRRVCGCGNKSPADVESTRFQPPKVYPALCIHSHAYWPWLVIEFRLWN